jgi:glutathione S-transferase
MADLRIFSYVPNPRIYKATIAARYCDVEIELLGVSPRELSGWLWDFDARPLTDVDRANPDATLRKAREGFQGELHKTDAFLMAHPFGTVPAAFSPDGAVGIFESNSIMRAVARLAKNDYPIYGRDPFEASRIDSFLDVSLVFSRESQIFQLAVARDRVTKEIYEATEKALTVYMGGIEAALANGKFLVGDCVTLADICFAAEIIQFSQTRRGEKNLRKHGFAPLAGEGMEKEFSRASAHFRSCAGLEEFAPDLGKYLAKIDGGQGSGRRFRD